MWMKAKLSFFFFLSFFFPNTHVRVDEVSGERLPHHEEANNSANRSWPGTTKDDSRCLRSAIVGCEEPFLARCWLTEELNSDEGKKKKIKISTGNVLPLSLYLHLTVSHSQSPR